MIAPAQDNSGMTKTLGLFTAIVALRLLFVLKIPTLSSPHHVLTSLSQRLRLSRMLEMPEHLIAPAKMPPKTTTFEKGMHTPQRIILCCKRQFSVSWHVLTFPIAKRCQHVFKGHTNDILVLNCVFSLSVSVNTGYSVLHALFLVMIFCHKKYKANSKY